MGPKTHPVSRRPLKILITRDITAIEKTGKAESAKTGPTNCVKKDTVDHQQPVNVDFSTHQQAAVSISR